jgi:RNA methyltransferase, TrmH family
MITSADNEKLKTIRKLQQKRWRSKLGLFAAEGEDLVAAAASAGWEPDFVLRAGEDVEPELLAHVSSLGSGSRVIGVYRERWARAGGRLGAYLEGVADPGNVGAIVRSTHALADGPVTLGPGCADPYSPKAVRASMGSIFERPPARAPGIGALPGFKLVLSAHGGKDLREVGLAAPLVIGLGSEREGMSSQGADAVARIPLREGGPESLNVAMAATLALYEVANRMAADA